MFHADPVIAVFQIAAVYVFAVIVLFHASGRLKGWQKHRLEALKGQRRKEELAAINGIVSSYLSVTGKDGDDELADRLRRAFGLVSAPSVKGFDLAALEAQVLRLERAIRRSAETVAPEEIARQERVERVLVFIRDQHAKQGRRFKAEEIKDMLEIASRPTIIYLPAAEAALRVRVATETMPKEGEGVPAAAPAGSRTGRVG